MCSSLRQFEGLGSEVGVSDIPLHKYIRCSGLVGSTRRAIAFVRAKDNAWCTPANVRVGKGPPPVEFGVAKASSERAARRRAKDVRGETAGEAVVAAAMYRNLGSITMSDNIHYIR
jgi:hypothetical protein